MHRLRDTTGQAAVDWIAVVGVVTVALALAGTAFGGSAIAGIVVRQFDRALCIVSGGDCNEDRVPCTTASGIDSEDQSITIAIVKVTSTVTLMIEKRSDGTYRITRTRDGGEGIDGGLGASVSFSGLGLKLQLGGEARASVLAHEGAGETWLAHSQREAVLDEELLVLGKHPKGEPAQRYRQTGWVGSLGALLSVDVAATVAGSISQDAIDGSRTDANGDVTTYFRLRDDSDVSGQVGEILAGVALTHMDSTDYALRVDRTGRPIDFEVFTVGRLAAGAPIPGPSASLTIAPRHQAGDAYEVEQHLDLSDPDNLAAALAFMKAQRDGDLRAGSLALHALAARFTVDGVEQMRSFRLKQNSFAAKGSVALGLKLGGSYKHSTIEMALADARVRGPDGVWTARDDCLAAARRA